MNLTITPQFTQVKNNQKLNILAFPAQKPNLPANSNLAPLARDTVSFSGKQKAVKAVVEAGVELVNGLRADKVGVEGPNAVKVQVLADLVNEAQVPLGYMQNVLSRPLRKYVSTDMNDDRIIHRIDFRVKSVDSAREKVNGLTKNMSEEEISKLTKEDIKAMLGDLVAGRIVMREDSKKAVKTVLQVLGSLVKECKFKITEIENYYPVEASLPENVVTAFRKDLGIKLDDKARRNISKPGFFSYADDKDIMELAKIARTTYPDLEPKYCNDLPNGYQALHINMLLPDNSRFELQIIGRDVEKLKEIEDYVYKAKCNKKVRNDALAEVLKPLGDKKEGQLRSEHVNYTRNAYIGQRLKGQQSYKSKTSERFLVAPKSILDRGLGYNQLLQVYKASKQS